MSDVSLFGTSGELLPRDGSAFLVPEFLPHEFADEALTELITSTPWENPQLLMFGKQVTEPRSSVWVSDGVTYTYSRVTRHPIPWTPLLNDIRKRCQNWTQTAFNGVLVNYYRSGLDHLGWHSDNERANGPEPVIASISLGAERRFDFRHNETREMVSVQLQHGSLLVMSGRSQDCWMHRVARTTRVLSPRVNLTFRSVDARFEPQFLPSDHQ